MGVIQIDDHGWRIRQTRQVHGQLNIWKQQHLTVTLDRPLDHFKDHADGLFQSSHRSHDRSPIHLLALARFTIGAMLLRRHEPGLGALFSQILLDHKVGARFVVSAHDQILNAVVSRVHSHQQSPVRDLTGIADTLAKKRSRAFLAVSAPRLKLHMGGVSFLTKVREDRCIAITPLVRERYPLFLGARVIEWRHIDIQREVYALIFAEDHGRQGSMDRAQQASRLLENDGLPAAVLIRRHQIQSLA